MRILSKSIIPRYTLDTLDLNSFVIAFILFYFHMEQRNSSQACLLRKNGQELPVDHLPKLNICDLTQTAILALRQSVLLAETL
ncbi:MAG: hypothetical protein NVS9B9_12480 [Ktedonobacteraceae bacterium]